MNPLFKIYFRQYFGTVLSLVLFFAGVWFMCHTFSQYRWDDVRRGLADISNGQLLLAGALCISNYLLLTYYDHLSFKYIKVTLPYRAIALASFVSFTFSHNIGAALVSGGGVRYRIYSTWGVSAANVGRIILFTGMNYWTGFFLMGGLVLLIHPVQLPKEIDWIGQQSHPLGVFFLVLVAAYILFLMLKKKPIDLFGYYLPVPTLSLTARVCFIACLDWALAAAVFFVLLPPGVSFFVILGVFFIAQVAGVLSHVPGGLGVFEGITMAFLTPAFSPADVLSAVIMFRIIYYISPFLVGMSLFGYFEIYLRKRVPYVPAPVQVP